MLLLVLVQWGKHCHLIAFKNDCKEGGQDGGEAAVGVAVTELICQVKVA